MPWSQGNYIVMEATSITMDNGAGDWFYVGHFLGMHNGQPKGAIVSRGAGPYPSEGDANTQGKDKAGKEALKILTNNHWPA